MTQPITPEPQSDDPAQQVPGSANAQTPEGYVEKARFDGLMKKVQDLTAELRDANANIQQKSSRAEQLQTEIDTLTAQGDARASEMQTQLNSLQQEMSDLSSVKSSHESMKLKLKVAKEMGRPELMQLADRIPDLTDEVEIEAAFKDFAKFTDMAVMTREQQLTAGLTPVGGPTNNATPAAPQTLEGWQQHIESLPLGSSEREAAMTQFGKLAREKASINP